MTLSHLLSLPLAGIGIRAPSGTAWQFLVLFLVVIVGPPLLERARVPGILGLLIGGYVIGPNGLNLIGAGNTTVPALGQLGLLYLMFVAGVELDLGLIRVHRRGVIVLGLGAFAMPMLLGSIVGFSMHWEVAAALLLGSTMASHTLLVYPAVRSAGLGAHRAAATAVGATVITDTLTLTVLAFVSGSQVDGGSAATIALQVGLGLVLLGVFSMVALPRLVQVAFRYLGTDRVVRYLLAVASFLAAATLAQSLGIEGIVGAFFAGLGLNRLVPNEGPLMERIDFFGSAVFVPIFLVTVGFLLKPSVMLQGETLKLAGLFILAAFLGKAIATFACKPTLKLSVRESGLMLGMTLPQAAATLAATVVGFDIGLFDQSVVNAMLVLILVSILTATVLVDRVMPGVSVPMDKRHDLGKRVLVALEDPDQAPVGFAVGARLAAPDTGVVRGLLGSAPKGREAREAALTRLRRVGFGIGVDTDPSAIVHGSFAEGIVNAVAEHDPSFVLVGQRSLSVDPVLGSPGQLVAASIASPVAVLVGETDKIREVLLLDPDLPRGSARDAFDVASAIAARVGGRKVTVRQVGGSEPVSQLTPGQLAIGPTASLSALPSGDPPAGTAIVMVLDPLPALPVEGSALFSVRDTDV